MSSVWSASHMIAGKPRVRIPHTVVVVAAGNLSTASAVLLQVGTHCKNQRCWVFLSKQWGLYLSCVCGHFGHIFHGTMMGVVLLLCALKIPFYYTIMTAADKEQQVFFFFFFFF